MDKKKSELQVYSGIAIFFVVILHSNAYYLMNVVKLKSYLDAGIFIYLIDKIVHAAVPMFIFIAGYKYEMNSGNKGYKEFFLKKYNSIFKPFFYVSTFYLLYRWINVYFTRLAIYKTVDMHFILNNIIRDFFRMFLGYNFAYQLWYIPMYLFIILSYPVIKKYIKNDYIRAAFFISLAMIWEVLSNLNIASIANHPYPLLFVYYFFIYEMGCLFYSKKYYCKSLKTIVPVYIAILMALVIIKDPLLVRIISDLVLNPVSTIFFYYLSVRLKNIKTLIMLGNYSFYIYLFHEPLILSTASRYLLNHGMYRFGILAPALAIYSIAVISVFLTVSSRGIFRKVIELFTKNEKQAIDRNSAG